MVLQTRDRLLDDASHLAIVVALLNVKSLIVKFLSPREGDLDLEVSSVAKVSLGRDDGEACILLLFREVANVLLMQQEASPADGVMIEGVASKVARGDVDVVEVELGVFDAGVSVAQVEFARADRLDLRAEQLDAALVGV